MRRAQLIPLIPLLIFALTALSPLGCTARRTETTTTRTEVEDTDSTRAQYAPLPSEDTAVVSRSETKTVETHDDSGGGLFSIVGDIIALPFRAVGALLSAIF